MQRRCKQADPWACSAYVTNIANTARTCISSQVLQRLLGAAWQTKSRQFPSPPSVEDLAMKTCTEMKRRLFQAHVHSRLRWVNALHTVSWGKLCFVLEVNKYAKWCRLSDLQYPWTIVQTTAPHVVATVDRPSRKWFPTFQARAWKTWKNEKHTSAALIGSSNRLQSGHQKYT